MRTVKSNSPIGIVCKMIFNLRKKYPARKFLKGGNDIANFLHRRQKKKSCLSDKFLVKETKKDYIRQIKTKSANIQHIIEKNNKQIRCVSVCTK